MLTFRECVLIFLCAGCARDTNESLRLCAPSSNTNFLRNILGFLCFARPIFVDASSRYLNVAFSTLLIDIQISWDSFSNSKKSDALEFEFTPRKNAMENREIYPYSVKVSLRSIFVGGWCSVKRAMVSISSPFFRVRRIGKGRERWFFSEALIY